MEENKLVNFYLEKTFSQNPSDVAHLLKYLYFSRIRCDTKHWYHFTNHRWYRLEIDQSPLIPLIKNEVVNMYLTLSDQYNKGIKKITQKLNELEDENPEKMETYLPLIRSDLMFKSKLCLELGAKLIDQGFCQKVNYIAQELLTHKNFANTLDTNPHLLAFNNGVMYLPNQRFDLPISSDRVSMTIGYDYDSESNQYTAEIIEFFEKLGLKSILPLLGSFLSGVTRQPLVWIKNLTPDSIEALREFLDLVLGDYCGSLPFSDLRKRKITNHNPHTELVQNCKKRLVIVEQTEEDYPGVYFPMIEKLLSNHLTLRMPYENTYTYNPQFGLLILSSKKDSEPLEDSLLFEANSNINENDLEVKKEWQLDAIKLLLKEGNLYTF